MTHHAHILYTGYALPAYNVYPMAVGPVLRVYCWLLSPAHQDPTGSTGAAAAPSRVQTPGCWHTPDPEDLRYLGYRDSRPRIHGSQGLGSWSTHPVDESAVHSGTTSWDTPWPCGSWESLYLSSRHSLALWAGSQASPRGYVLFLGCGRQPPRSIGSGVPHEIP